MCVCVCVCVCVRGAYISVTLCGLVLDPEVARPLRRNRPPPAVHPRLPRRVAAPAPPRAPRITPLGEETGTEGTGTGRGRGRGPVAPRASHLSARNLGHVTILVTSRSDAIACYPRPAHRAPRRGATVPRCGERRDRSAAISCVSSDLLYQPRSRTAVGGRIHPPRSISRGVVKDVIDQPRRGERRNRSAAGR